MLLEMSGELLSSGPEAAQERRVRSYFRKPESRVLYWLLLRGTKHFGYYPPGSRRLSMARAMRMMEDKLGTTLKLPPGSWVLDAGCGEGDVAIRMATRFGLHVDGVDASSGGCSVFRESSSTAPLRCRCTGIGACGATTS